MAAVEFALPLISRFGANLHLAHVFEPGYPLSSMVALPLVVPQLQVGQRVRRHLKDVAKKYSVELRPGNTHAARGKPFAEICRLARDHEIDLVVIATRGNTGLKHLALGSTAERVVRYSPCPVLVLPQSGRKPVSGHNGKGQRPVGFKRVLVPTDFSDCSMKGLDYAVALARHFDAELVLLNSVAIQYYVTSDEYARYDYPQLLQVSERVAREQMDKLVRKLAAEDVHVESLVEVGHAGLEICAAAEAQRANLIVTSTHGTTGLKHVLLGSTAEYVVRHSCCPVLVVPARQRPFLPATKRKNEKST